ncbi:MAG: SdrD B-like domain-containing protein [Stenotrophomonas sp.]|uniref:SdrD B-like domain-containing protein n=1 Tax=Stenotrophomonas sp. TaxID=69392 RepID=UPI003D6D03A0
MQLLTADNAVQNSRSLRHWAMRMLGLVFVPLLLGWMPAAMAANLEITNLSEVIDPIPAGGVIEYKLTIHNGGPEPVPDSVVAFDLPAGTSAIDLPAYCSVDALVSTRVVCIVPQNLANGDSFDIDLKVSTVGLGPSTVDITAAVGRQPAPNPRTPLADLLPSDPFFAGDPNTDDNLETQNTTLIAAGDLQMEKTGTPNPVPAGGEVTYTITVTNNGPSVSTNFNVTDALPSGVTYVAGSAQSASGGWTFNNQNGTHAGALAVGASATYTFKGKVNVASGNLVNSATVNAVGTPDPNASNNSDDAAVTVAAGADLAIGKTASPIPALPGELITFTVTVTNNGPSPAENVSWTDPMPDGFLIESGSTIAGWDCSTNAVNTERSCALPSPATLAVGASATFTIVARVPLTGPGSSGPVANTASVSGSLPDPDPSNDEATANFTVLPNGADLSLTKSKAPQLVPTWPGPGATPPAGSGYIVTSTINVNNIGPAPATSDVQVVDQLAVGEEYFPSDTTPWTCLPTPYVPGSRQTVTCTLKADQYPVLAGQTKTLKLQSFAHPEAEGSPLTNNACTGGSGGSLSPGTDSGLGDPNGANNCSGGTITPSPLRSDLSVAKRTNDVGTTDNTLPVGYTGMSYTITVSNAGPDDTRGVVVEDTLPGFLQGRTTATTVDPSGWTCTVSATGTLHCESGTTPLVAGTPVDIVVNLSGPLADSASRPAGPCGAAMAPAGAWCNTAGVGIDPFVPGAAGEINPVNNTGSDYVRVPRVSNVKTEAKTITGGNPGNVGINSTYRIDYRNEGPSSAPGVVFRDVIHLRGDDPGFTLVTDTRSGGGINACVPSVTGGVTLLPGSGGLNNVSSLGAGPGTLVLTCTPLDLPGGQQQSMTVVIRPLDDPTGTGQPRVYANTADFFFDRDGDGAPDPSAGSDAFGDFEYNNIATVADDEKEAVLTVGEGDVDLVVNKHDTGFAGGVDPLGYDPNNPDANFITYQVTVQNLGPSVASSVKITDTITPNAGKTVEFIGASPTATGTFSPIRCTVTGGSNPITGGSLVLTCDMPGSGFSDSETIGVVDAGATSTLYLRYRYQSQPGAGGDTVENSAVASSAEPELNPANNQEDETTAIRSKVDLAIVKQAVSRTTPPSADPAVALPPVLSTVSIREPFFWVFDVENRGPGNSLSRLRTGTNPLNGTGTVITDTLPPDMVVTGAPITWRKVGPNIASLSDEQPNGTGNCTQSGQIVTCNVGDVTSEGSNHGRVRVIIPVRWDVIPPGGSAINTATVGTEQVDSDPNNDTSTAPIKVTASSLAGTVFQDRDRAGSNGGVPQDATTEPRIGSVTLVLTGTDAYDNPVNSTTSTDGNGDYQFDLLSPSDARGYRIVQTQPAGFANGPVDPPVSGPLAPSFGGTYAAGTPDSNYSAIPVPADSDGVRYNFPELSNARLAGFVYVDVDYNNTRTVGSDPPIVGATVELLDAATSAVLKTATTDATGAYQFIDLDPNRIYTLREVMPAGMYRNRPSAVNPGTINGAACSSGCVAGTGVGGDAPTTDRISQIDLRQGIGTQEGLDFNFGEEPTGSSLAGRVWLDANNNGLIDSGETGIAGVTISLSGTAQGGVAVSLGQTTDANGAYRFLGLSPGTYTVTEPEQPADTRNGITVAGSTGGTVTAVSVTPSVISGIVLAIDEASIDNNFGEIGSSSIAGRVYYDNNKNGIIDADESGIANVTLQLTGDDDLPPGTATRAIIPPRTVVTDANGAYLFDNLRPGTYTVTEPTQPPNTTNGITTPGTVDGAPMGVATPVTTVPSAISAITLTFAQASIEQNFGEVADTPDLVVSKSADPTRFTVNNPASYTVRVRNIGPQPSIGSYQVDDRLPTGVTLSATPTGNGWTCSGAPGADRFSCTHSAVIASGATLPDAITVNVAVGAAAAAASPIHNAVIVRGGGEDTDHMPSVAEQGAFDGDVTQLPICDPAITQNACRVQTEVQAAASLSGTVWFDIGSDDALLDGGDVRLQNWTVELFDKLTNTVVRTASTGADGSYRFNDLLPGTRFEVRFRHPQSGVLWGFPVTGETASGPAAPCDSDAAIANGTASTCRVDADGITQLEVVLRSGDNLPQQSLPVDPSGVVYDAVTRNPVQGAIVTFAPNGMCAGYDPATSVLNGGQGGYSIDGDRISMTVGSDGYYQFLLGPAAPSRCEFTLTVTPPGGYTFKSVIIPPEASSLSPPGASGTTFSVQPQASAPTAPVGTATQYFLALFAGSGTANIVHNHLPLDPAVSPGLVISKTGDKQVVEVGDTMLYTISIRQTAGEPLNTVNVIDNLPPGFTYINGTARADGRGIDDPFGKPGPRLVFNVGPIRQGQQILLNYRVRIGVGAMQGDGINRAQAHGCSTDGGCVDPGTLYPYPGGVPSNPAQYRVRVTGGVFTDEACVLGKIFVDSNNNHLQDREEIGIPGVRFYFNDGTWMVSDSEGKYSYCGLPPKSHTLKVDNSTLPHGARLITSSNRNLGDADSLFIDLKNGELHRADFIEGSGSNEVLEQVKARRTQGEISAPERELQGLPLSFQAQPLMAPTGATDSANQQPSIVAPRGTLRPEPASVSSTGVPMQGVGTTVNGVTTTVASASGDALPSNAVTSNGLPVLGSGVSAAEQGSNVAMQADDRRFDAVLGSNVPAIPQSPASTNASPQAINVQSGTVDYSVNTDVELVRVNVDRDGVPADGQSPVHVVVQLLGADEKPLPGKRFATVEYSGGRVRLTGGGTDEFGPGRLDADRGTPGIQLPVENGRAEFDLLAPDVPQDVLLRITSGGVAAENTVSFLPEMRELLATGLVEGIVNFRNGAALETARRDDGFDRDIRRWERDFNNGKANAAARTAFFVKGKIKGEYLLTAAYDSDKEVRGRLLRDIQPEEFYPVYGDSSLRGFDARSAERLYVRIDKNRSYLMYGDFQTGDTLTTQTGITASGKAVMRSLGTYNRTATGFGWHFEGKRVRGNVFAMEDSLRQVIDEFPSQGSGPYALSNNAVLEGSERVEVITRDRNQPSRIINVRALGRLVDYSFEPFSGRILLNSFLPGFDSELNPVSLRVTYELDQGTEKFWVYGVDAQFRVNKYIEVGGAYVNDENPFAPFKMGSANVGFRFGPNTWMVLEGARTESEVNTNSINQYATPGLQNLSGDVAGDAYRLEFAHDGKQFDARVFAGRSDPAFNNPSSPLYGGRGEYDLELNWAVNERFQIYVEAMRSEDRNPQGGDRNAAGAGVRIDATQRLTLDLGVRAIRETVGAYSPWSISPPFGNSGGLSGGFATGSAGGALGYGQQPLDPLTGLPIIRSEGTVPNSSLPVGTELESDSVHVGAGYKLSDKLVLGGEYEQDVNGEDRNRFALGADYRLRERNRLYGRYEKQTGLTSAYGITTTDRESDALVFGVDSTYLKDTQVFSEYRLRDAIAGRDVQMASGIRNDWNVTEGLRLSTAAEHVKIYDGNTGDATALALGLDYSANPLWRGAMRLEYRISGDVDGTLDTNEEFNTTLFQLMWARKLNRDWTLLARNYLLSTDYKARGDVMQDRFQLGVAYRDTDRNRINALARYEYKLESDKSGMGINGAPTQDIGQDIRTAAHIVSTHADWHPSRPWWLTGRIAAKWQKDRFAYADGDRVNDSFRGVLISGRVVYDITENWDIGVLGTTFRGDYGANQYAYGMELGRLLRQNLWLSAGYNFVGFAADPDLAGYEYTDEGAFIRLRFKFDEDLFRRDDHRYRKPAQQ